MRTTPLWSTAKPVSKAVAGVVVVALLAWALGGVAYGWSMGNHHRSVEDRLSVAVSIAREGAGLWAGHLEEETAQWAGSEAVVPAVEAGVGASGVPSPECDALVAEMKTAVEGHRRSGAQLIDRNGIVLCSVSDYLIGGTYRAFDPTSGLGAIDRGGFVHVNRPLGLEEWVHDVGAPVRNAGGETIAFLVVSFHTDFLTELVMAGKFGDTGETYVFAKQGWIITPDGTRSGGSEDADRTSSEAQGSGDAVSLFLPNGSPLLAAAAGRSDPAGHTLHSYPDYRGDAVVGAWEWLPGLGLGVAAEMDESEFAGTETGIRRVYAAAAAALGILLAALVGVFVRLSRRHEEAVALAARLDTSFAVAPVAMWEEDFSAVATWLNSIPARSPSALRSYLEEHPNEVDHGISLIRVHRVNPGAERLIDQESGEVLFGGEAGDPITPETRAAVIEQMVTIATGGGSLRVAIGGRTQAGDQIDAILHWQAAALPSGRFDYSKVVVAIVDISENVQARRRLEESVRSKEQLIASISHELRTPLTSVIGYAALLRDAETGMSAEDRREMASLVVAQGEEISHIVEDLLASARSGMGTLRVSRVPVTLRAQVAQVIEATPAPAGASIEVVGEGGFALADPARVRQILRNLLVNAFRYGGDSIRIEVGDTRQTVRVLVADDGAGVPAADADRIFLPYESSADHAGQPGSVGLGLAVSRELAQVMGGDLTYERRNHETVFALTLPSLLEGGRRDELSGAEAAAS